MSDPDPTDGQQLQNFRSDVFVRVSETGVFVHWRAIRWLVLFFLAGVTSPHWKEALLSLMQSIPQA